MISECVRSSRDLLEWDRLCEDFEVLLNLDGRKEGRRSLIESVFFFVPDDDESEIVNFRRNFERFVKEIIQVFVTREALAWMMRELLGENTRRDEK